VEQVERSKFIGQLGEDNEKVIDPAPENFFHAKKVGFSRKLT